jgi:hypothetical protein
MEISSGLSAHLGQGCVIIFICGPEVAAVTDNGLESFKRKIL